MQNLVNTVKMIAQKFLNDFETEIDTDIVRLKFYIKNTNTGYKTLEITEQQNKLNVKFFPSMINKIMDISELENVILIINKQTYIIEHSEQEIKKIKEKYVSGTKIELIKMYDLQAPLPKTIGKVAYVDDVGTVHVDWENGSALGLVIGIDEFKIIYEQEMENLDETRIR